MNENMEMVNTNKEEESCSGINTGTALILGAALGFAGYAGARKLRRKIVGWVCKMKEQNEADYETVND